MILYSIIPYEIIFSNQYNEDNKEVVNMMYEGELVEAVNLGGQYKIRRILSSNPKVYLDKKFMLNNKIIDVKKS